MFSFRHFHSDLPRSEAPQGAKAKMAEEKKPDTSEPINIKVVTQAGNEICARLANGPSIGSPDVRRRLS